METGMKKATTSVLLWEAQAAVLQAAATKAGKNVSEYVRDVLVPVAAQDAGIPVPRVPVLAKPPAKRSVSGTRVAPTAQEIAAAMVDELIRRGKVG